MLPPGPSATVAPGSTNGSAVASIVRSADPTKEITRAYGALGWMGMAKRWTFYIDPDGTIVQIDKNVKPKTAGIDLAVSLGELGVPAAEASGQEAAAGR